MPDPRYDVEKLVTLETFSSPWEAQLARASLEAEGIYAAIADEHFQGLYGGALSSTLGGVRLQVRPADLERATELLRTRRPILYLVTDDDEASDPEAPRFDEAGEPEALVIVGRFATPWEAHLARTLLESEGIDACVLEERLPAVSLLSGEPTALGRLEVHRADAPRALEILSGIRELDEASET